MLKKLLQECNFICLVILLFFLCADGFSQTKEFHKDSLKVKSELSPAKSPPADIPLEFLKGIVQGNYKKLSSHEFIPTTTKEMPRIPLPVLRPHPRLITQNQIQQARLNIAREPHQHWYQLIKERVDIYISQKPILRSPVTRQAEDIKNLAFVYQVEGDRRYLEAVVQLLEQLPEAPKILNLEGGRANMGWGDFLQSAQALPAVTVALDLIYNEIDIKLRDDTRRKLLDVTRQLLDAALYTPANNHITVFAVAILVSALFDDNPRDFISFSRLGIWENGLLNLSRGLGLAIPDGGYGEGVYYARFILNYIAPLSVYFKNATGLNLFENPGLERMINWVNANDHGDGTYSAFDDAFQVDFFILPVVIPQGRMKNDWYAHWASLPPQEVVRDNMAEAIVVFETLPFTPSSTANPVQFYADHGQAIFRDQSLNPQIFGSFLTEKEEWFASRHEQIDPLHFELSAYEEQFIVDGGYGGGTNDINRSWYLSARAHNGFFVNGLGTYRNPIYGDPISSQFRHAFQTSRAASVSMIHSLGPVDIKRKVLFFDNRYFLILDQFEGDRETETGLNFNYLGSFQRVSQNQFRIRKRNANLDIITLDSHQSKPIVTQNFGLYTPPGKPRPMRTFQITQPSSRKGFFVTLLCPNRFPGSRINLTQQAVKGEGEAIMLRGGPGFELITDIAVNRGSVLESARWKSDAQLIWVKYDPTMQLNGLLLVNFTRFVSTDLKIYTDFPITIYLERNNFFWQGYIEVTGDLKKYNLTIEGIDESPFRFNRQVVEQQKKSDGLITLSLSGSGTLDIGSGPAAVQIPYQFHPPPNLLTWMNDQPKPVSEYEFWSDYHRTVFNNQLVRRLQDGLEQGIMYWNDRLFPGTQLIRNSWWVLSGIMEESYSSRSSTTFTPRMSHWYQFSGTANRLNWSVFEEGIFSVDFLRIQNLRIQAQMQDGLGLNYRASNWFEGQQMHQLRFYWPGGSQVFYQFSGLQNSNEQHLQFTYQDRKFSVNPGYSWNNFNDDSDAFINLQMNKYRAFWGKSRSGAENNYYQFLSGYGKKWAFSLEGRQVDATRDDNQLYLGDFFYKFYPGLNISQGVQFSKKQDWKLSHFYSELNWRNKNWSVRGGMDGDDSQVNQRTMISWKVSRHKFFGSINLTDFRFNRQNIFRLRWNYRNRNGMAIYTNAVYKYWPVRGKYGADLFQSVWFPLNINWQIQPILGQTFPSNEFLQWVGGGLNYNGRHSLFAQVSANRTSHPYIINYQLIFTFNQNKFRPVLNTWFQLSQSGNQIHSVEIQVQRADQPLQPGLYYSFFRGVGTRFEGFLEWKW